jgi:hypothetical protein
MDREAKTIGFMIDIYCHDRHGHDRHGHGRHGAHDALCPECSELRDYALARLDKCPFQESKSTCANCAVHCYKPDMRQRVREVMRYSGPRMMWRHPILALVHLLIDGRRAAPALPGKKANV